MMDRKSRTLRAAAKEMGLDVEDIPVVRVVAKDAARLYGGVPKRQKEGWTWSGTAR